jgi:murein hydrolase activator
LKIDLKGAFIRRIPVCYYYCPKAQFAAACRLRTGIIFIAFRVVKSYLNCHFSKHWRPMIRTNQIYIFLPIVCIFFLPLSAVAETSTENANHQKELQTLHEEIQKYEQQLSQQKEKEKNAANLIADLDREIDVTSSVLYGLRGELQAQERQIAGRTQEISRLEAQCSQLKEIIKKRLVSFYKYGHRREYELLLTENAWKHVDVWLRYQKLIAENDRRNYQALVARKEKLEREKLLLQQDVQQKEFVLGRHQQNAANLKSSRAKREGYLKSLEKDSQFLRNHVQELQSAQKQITEYIANIEKKRVEAESQRALKKQAAPQLPRNARFAALQGQLPWPAEGTIISRFGKFRHPTLKTVTENLGIEIQAPLGSPVRVVDDGQVQTITWQRGRGNIIIISHDDGFYTVYTHLADIRVNVSENVEAGHVIGTVGDSGSLSGPILHFQIWKNTENLDPEKWLSKSGAPRIALNSEAVPVDERGF